MTDEYALHNEAGHASMRKVLNLPTPRKAPPKVRVPKAPSTVIRTAPATKGRPRRSYPGESPR